MPATPKADGGDYIRHAANDILGRVDLVDEGPETEESPGDEEFEPDEVEVEVANHGELEGSVAGP